jgi:hypothetical protein
MLPRPVDHQDSEQLSVQIIHRITLFAKASSPVRIASPWHLASDGREFDCDAAHLAETTAYFRGNGVLRMASSCNLGNVHGQRIHALNVSDDLRTSSSGITLTSDPARRRANRGACSSRARKSSVARRSAAASSARPPDSMTAMSAPATYSPTSSVPTSDKTAIRSTPARPRRKAARTQNTAGTTATNVPAIQHQSAISCRPASDRERESHPRADIPLLR